MKTNLVAKVVVTLLLLASASVFAGGGNNSNSTTNNKLGTHVPTGNDSYPAGKFDYSPGGGNGTGGWNSGGTGGGNMGPGDGYDVRPGQGANQAKPNNNARGNSPCFAISTEVGSCAYTSSFDPLNNNDVFQIYETMVKGPNASQTASSKECADGSEACHDSGDNADNRLSFMDISGVAPAGADGVIGGLPPGQAMRTTIYTISGGVNTTVPGIGLGLRK